MNFDTVYIGNNKLKSFDKSVQGNIVSRDGVKYYKISNFDHMPPFFMNIVSDSDLWMFLSSNGALTAGRKNPDTALFPYYTDDRIQDSNEITGSKTLLIINRDDKACLWEPFTAHYRAVYRTECNIYKNMAGNQVIFEHINHDLDISFSYTWMNCDPFGFVRKSVLKNLGDQDVSVSMLDGIQNILPYGADRKFQLEFSTLLDAYKKNELLADSTLALYTLSSIPTDKAEPSEALKATTVWSTGLEPAAILLSASQLDLFRRGEAISTETDVKAHRGAYFVQSSIQLDGNGAKCWYLVADLEQDQARVAMLANMLTTHHDLAGALEKQVELGSENLKTMVARADGLQLGNDQWVAFRHFSNTLFNIMRGGIIEQNYHIDPADFHAFLAANSKTILEKHQALVATLNDQLTTGELELRVKPGNDPLLEKVSMEYLPLTFSRRHGDPSRPWNYFSINIRDEHGNKKLNYQGNWRDIFQNWEALALSFPGYLMNMITKFVNASTADGYNPYRVTRDGFEWEVLNPEEAWSNIGYWGDHQIVYLQRLLDMQERYYPGTLATYLERDVFTYANVPYRIRPYQDIVNDPHNTIDFDLELHKLIEQRVETTGTDGKFVWGPGNQVVFVNLAEKLLVTLLVKMSNFVPQAGIWMNTQRPEWNDANNALAGYGTSMVTCYYLKKYLTFCLTLFRNAGHQQYRLSKPVAALLQAIHTAFSKHKALLNKDMTAAGRKAITDALGLAGSNHRQEIYNSGLNHDRVKLAASELIAFLELALQYIDHSIASNKRDDGLYHAYNLIKFDPDAGIIIRHLYEMLEGQVAILGSGYLSASESLKLLKSLRNSALYRKDQASYLLYPDRKLARFMEKNIVPVDQVEKSRVLAEMVRRNDASLVIRDHDGQIHFNGRFRNAGVLKDALQQLNNGEAISPAEEQFILSIYESVFDHQSFTGRSGSFFKYEGLGSIYWHMVSKLLLAVQETIYNHREQAPNDVLEGLGSHYDEIQKGIGVHKNPELYGAFTTDPYSHTPAHCGVQQPGMTGQVKEDIISRFGELGLRVENGKIGFNAMLLKPEEFLTNSQVYEYYDVNGKRQTLMLNPGMLAYTVCQVPVIYIMSTDSRIVLTSADDKEKVIYENELDANTSKSIFQRRDEVKRIQVLVKMD